MKLDREINKNGKGKYAVVRLRGIEDGDEAYLCLKRLEELGHLDWGLTGQQDEFFVIKLRDRFADAALRAYSKAVMAAAGKCKEFDESKELAQYALSVQKLESRAGTLSPFCKTPD